VTTALRIAVITRHGADVLRSGVRDAFAHDADDDACYEPVLEVLNGFPAVARPTADGGDADRPPSLRTSLDWLRRKFVRHAIEGMA